MVAKKYGVAELVQLFADLARPVADAWRAEGGPGWWARAKARVAGWLRRQADRLSPPESTPIVTVSLEVRAVLPEPATAPEPLPPAGQAAQPAHSCAKATRPRRPAARPVPQKAAARATRPAKPRSSTPRPKAKTRPKGMTRRTEQALRKLEKGARRILRSLKVGVLPDLIR